MLPRLHLLSTLVVHDETTRTVLFFFPFRSVPFCSALLCSSKVEHEVFYGRFGFKLFEYRAREYLKVFRGYPNERRQVYVSTF